MRSLTVSRKATVPRAQLPLLVVFASVSISVERARSARNGCRRFRRRTVQVGHRFVDDSFAANVLCQGTARRMLVAATVTGPTRWQRLRRHSDSRNSVVVVEGSGFFSPSVSYLSSTA